MKTLEDLLIVTEHGPEILPAGSVIKEAGPDYIDVDPGSLEADPQKSMGELAAEVEQWMANNKARVDSGELSPRAWEAVSEGLVGLLKLIHNGDKEGIVTHLEALKAAPSNPLTNVMIKAYTKIAEQLGSFEIMKGRILNRESIEVISGIIREMFEDIDRYKLLCN